MDEIPRSPLPSHGSAEVAQYGGFTRFELELEFVQCLGNPWYLNHLALQKYYDKPEFVVYLAYLQYFRQPQYAKHLVYPGPTLRALDLLQQKKFREDILKPEVVVRMIEEGVAASVNISEDDKGLGLADKDEEEDRMDITG